MVEVLGHEQEIVHLHCMVANGVKDLMLHMTDVTQMPVLVR